MHTVPIVSVLLFAGSLLFCHAPTRQKHELSGTTTEEVEVAYDSTNRQADADDPEKKEPKFTRLRFPGFSVVIHDFTGYEASGETGNRGYVGQFGGGSDLGQAYLNDSEINNEDYAETLVALKDTVELSEILFDDRINNTLFQVLPKNANDKFKLSYCYLSRLQEIIDYRNYSEEELRNMDYTLLESFSEQTPVFRIRDSAKYFFRALPHSPDMAEVTVTDGKVETKKYNTPEEINWEQKQFDEEIKRIKKKYDLHDTLVVIPGEYDTEVTLARGNKLFGYGYESFLFRIERYTGNKLAETRFILIHISYGC